MAGPWAFAPFAFAGFGHQYEYRGEGSAPTNNYASPGLGFTTQPWSASLGFVPIWNSSTDSAAATPTASSALA